MRDIERYMDNIRSTIQRSYAIEDRVTYVTDDPEAGTIDGTLYFADGSRLEFSEAVELQVGDL